MAVQPIPGFTRLSFNVYISEPEKSLSNTAITKVTAADLILLNTWLNAQPRHIAKYTLTYRTLYPKSTIIVTTSSWHDWAYRSQASQDASLDPVIEYLLSLPPSSKILLHLFSNGGAWTATQTAFIYNQKTGKPVPISKMILDSSPGKHSYQRSTTAFAISLPSWRKNPIWRLNGLTWIYIGFGIATIVGILLRRDDPTVLLRRRLNDQSLFNGDAERLYLFGDKDIMVPPEDVVDHAQWAKAEGWKVRQERFLEGGHVAHAAVDWTRYWNAVERLWGSDDDGI